MTNYAIFEITDGTTSVSFVNGPFYVTNWRPALPGYKSGGSFIDPPMADGRRLVYRKFDNITERIDFVHRAGDVDLAAEDIRRLVLLLEKASQYWISDETGDAVYLKARAHGETNTRYATIVSWALPELANPFAMPFLQADCAVVQTDLSLVVEHSMWRDEPPGTYSLVNISPAMRNHNLVVEGDWERGHYAYSYWTSFGTPTEWQTRKERAHSGLYSVRIIATSGATKGIYQDINDLTPGKSYTITAYALPTAGTGELIAYDGGGFTNGVTDNTVDIGEELLTNTSFETDTSGWANYGFTTFSRSSSQAEDGSWSLRLQLTNASGVLTRATAQTSSFIDVSVGTHVEYSFSAYVDDPHTFSNLSMYGFVQWYTSSGKELDGTVVYGGGLYYRPAPGTPWPPGELGQIIDQPSSGEWHRYEIISEKPEGATKCKVGIKFISSGNDTMGMYFDNASLSAYVQDDYVGQIVQSNYWIPLSVTKTCPGSGSIRVALATNTSTGGTVYFDDIALNREYGQGDEPTARKVFFANYQGENNVSHVFRYDASLVSYSTNLLDETLPYNLFPDPTGSGDEVYFGSSTDNYANSTPFTSLLFDISSVAKATSIVTTWEYWTGSGWAGLTARDETNYFQRSGPNAVTWAMPSNWSNSATVNGVTGWWVRVRISTLTGTLRIPRVRNHPHIINSPYFDVDEDDVLGDVAQRMRYNLFNEGGPIRATELVTISAGADDVLVDTAGMSVTTSGSTATVSEDDAVVIRFQNVNVPQGAIIRNARLYFSAVTGYGGYIAYKIDAEDSDNSTAIGSWANYSGKSWTSQFEQWISYSNYWTIGSGGYHTDRTQNIALPIQEVVQRSGWVNGNSLSIRIIYDWGAGAGENRIFEMYESWSGAWMLEIDYVAKESFTTTMFMGSRSLSRGEDFRSYFNMSFLQPPSITLDTGTNTAFAIYPLGTIFSPSNQTLVINNFENESGSFMDRAIFRIHAPLSSQYVGKYRVFLRAAHQTVASEGSETQFRIKVSTGIGGAGYTGQTTLGKLNYPEILDMGIITVPNIGPADEISISVQSKRQTNAWVFLYDLILMPVDEWVAEFTSPSSKPGGVLDGSTFLDIDSITSERKSIKAVLRRENNSAAMASYIVAGGAASLIPNETQRVWALAMTNLAVSNTNNNSENASFMNAVHAVKAYGSRKYITFRGAK